MSIQDPIAKSADQVAVNSNQRAKGQQNIRYLMVVCVAMVIGAIMIAFMFLKPAPGQKTAQQAQVEQQRDQATAAVANPAKISPQSQNVTLEAEVADLKTQLDQEKQSNANLSNQNLGLQQQVAQVASQSQAGSSSRRGASGQLTGFGRDPSGDAGAYSPSLAGSASPLYAAARDAIAQQGATPPGAAAGLAGLSGNTPVLKREIKANLFSPMETVHPDATGTQQQKKGSAIDDVTIYDASQYVAPNSYVTAKVLVGVDMTAGVTNAQDPKPVLLRIEGPAIGVGSDGKFQQTDLKGCTVNGAAYAELSSEKVYIKLQKITCPVGNNKYMTSKVEGYVTYMGKAGVRGRVVSREGSFANKAFVAGTLQGLGQAMNMNVQRSINPTSVGSDGSTTIATAPLTDSQIKQAAIGSGIGNSASMMAQYYIQRAEQYQPVIEMPTGVNVEIVFLEGFKIATKGQQQ
jgi:conjugal transfer pilus assembly protein TraB